MDLFIYSDESGVFDHVHNDYYVYGGVIILGNKNLEKWRRMYAKVEKDVRRSTNAQGEIKAVSLDNKYKNKIFRSLNNCVKFACIIEQHRINHNIWNSKKDKRRYLDFAYKIAVKRALETLIKDGFLFPEDVENMYFYVDEHTTATNGRYELRDALEQEFKTGTFNYNYSVHFPPLFPDLKSLTLDYCNSAVPKNRLIRAADMIANTVYYHAVNNDYKKLNEIPQLYFTIQP